jgi:hypothetical protein
MIYTEMDTTVAVDGEAAGFRRLWAGVLLQAIRDISAVDNIENGIRDTRAGGFSASRLKGWFASDAMTVGAFAWICSYLGHNHVRIREIVAKNPQVLTGTRK